MLPLGFVAAIGVAWWIFDGVALADLLEQARPLGTLDGGEGRWVNMVWPNEHDSHADAIRVPATLVAISTALAGFLLATVFYCWRLLDAEDAKSQFRVLHRFLWNKWWFDELYDVLFVRPSLFLGRLVAALDLRWIDGLVHALANAVKSISATWEAVVDRGLVDGTINKFADLTFSLGLSLRSVQTGKLRQYVLFIVVGTVAVFVAATLFWGYSFAT